MATSLLDACLDVAVLDGLAGTPGDRVAPSLSDAQPRRRQHLLGEGLFTEALLRERKRADRFETPFAVLLVDAGDVPRKANGNGSRHQSANGSQNGNGNGSASAWAAIRPAVEAVRRDIDLVGWLEQDAVLGLLLPDTSRQAAGEAMRQLLRALAGRMGDTTTISAFSIRLYAQGGQPAPDDTDLPPVDLLLEAFDGWHASDRWPNAAKRVLDVAGSLGLLALFLPAFLFAFFAVKLSSSGPALFRQVRVGRRGKPFTMLKFRTMHPDVKHTVHQDYVTWFIKSSGEQPRTGNEVFKLTNDPRITRVGRFLRKTSLDELPQFWNVLRGDMSLVGPRPPLPFEVEQYQPWHRRRVLEAKPGVTGLWQVSGRSSTTFDEMVRLDLRYAKTHSVWTDIKILLATPRAMLSGKGAC
jgi:lipopolysaccharide/colanic/teichoic acid biosynthesis glycosyltransferase